MPFTLSHPAAVVPVARICRTPYAYSALVVGSMSPDFEYLFRLRPTATIGHTAVGLFAFCLPVGLATLWLWHAAVKRPASLLLPEALRERVATSFAPGPRVTAAGGIALAACVVAGAISHDAWDAFTHGGRGLVARVPALAATAFRIGGVDIAVFKVLQHTSTAVGFAVVAYALRGWLAEREPAEVEGEPLPSVVRRGVLAGLSALVACAGAAAGVAGSGSGELVRRIQLGSARGAVVALAAAAVGILAYAAACAALGVTRARVRTRSPRSCGTGRSDGGS